MAKNKIKTGKVELPDDEFENVNVRISMLLPETMIKDLKDLSRDDVYLGQYQVLMRQILSEGIAARKAKKKTKAG